MKKLTMIIMVLGLLASLRGRSGAACGELAESAGALVSAQPSIGLGAVAGQAGMGLPLNDNPTIDNVPLTASSAIVIGIQSDDGSVCIVYLEPINGGGQWAVPARGDIIGLLPDAITIASLGLAGLLLRRRSYRRIPIYRE